MEDTSTTNTVIKTDTVEITTSIPKDQYIANQQQALQQATDKKAQLQDQLDQINATIDTITANIAAAQAA